MNQRLVDGARPLFLIGCPRSGTTFAANLVNAHPEVLLTSETAAFMLLDDVIKRSDAGIRSGITYGKQYNKLLSSMLSDSYRLLLETFYERIAREQKRDYLSYWGEKHPHLHDCIERIDAVFPDACYIYLVRDPRDSTCSIAEMVSVDYLSAIGNWKTFADAYESFVDGLAPERVLTVRYEDMVGDYYGAAERIFDWLDLPVAAEVLAFLHRSKSVDAHATGRRRDFAKVSRGRWQQRLKKEELIATRALVGDFMDKYSYTDS